jgi:hypothetical protein
MIMQNNDNKAGKAKDTTKTNPPSQTDKKTADYDIGYGKPPLQSRFSKGRSGNPHGRPKGAKNKRNMKPNELHDLILEEAYREIQANDNAQNKPITIPIAKAALRSLAVNAAKGQTRSQKILFDLIAKTEALKHKEYDDNLKSYIEYHAVYKLCEEQSKLHGLPMLEMLPHPDDLRFDEETGRIIKFGPVSEELRARCEKLSDRLESFERSLIELHKMKKDPANADIMRQIDQEIEEETKLVAHMRDALKGWRRRK